MTAARALPIALVVIVATIGFAFWWMTAMPGRSWSGALEPLAVADHDLASRLRAHVIAIASTEHNMQEPEAFNLAYTDRGNFVAFVGNLEGRALVRGAVEAFRANARFPSEGVAAPGMLPGVDWSDHWAFWREGWPALMVTDTAPFRYPHYHSSHATPEKVDYERLARVVRGLEATFRVLDGKLGR